MQKNVPKKWEKRELFIKNQKKNLKKRRKGTQMVLVNNSINKKKN